MGVIAEEEKQMYQCMLAVVCSTVQDCSVASSQHIHACRKGAVKSLELCEEKSMRYREGFS